MGLLNTSLLGINEAFQSINPVIINIIIAILILLLVFIVGRIMNTVIRRLLQTLELNKLVFTYLRINLKIEKFLAALISFTIYFLTVIIAINQVGLLTIIIEILSYIVVIAIIFGILLGLRNIIPNIAAGIIIRRKLKLKKGMILETENLKGEIIKLNTVYVYVKTKDNDTIFVPFSTMLKQQTKISRK